MEYSAGLLNFTHNGGPAHKYSEQELWVIFSNVPADWCRVTEVICRPHHLVKQKR